MESSIWTGIRAGKSNPPNVSQNLLGKIQHNVTWKKIIFIDNESNYDASGTTLNYILVVHIHIQNHTKWPKDIGQNQEYSS